MDTQFFYFREKYMKNFIRTLLKKKHSDLTDSYMAPEETCSRIGLMNMEK